MQVQHILKELSKDYDKKRPADGHLLAKIVSLVRPYMKLDLAVLDLGCGTGRFLVPLAQKYPKSGFIGIDLSPNMLKQLRSKAEKCRLKNIKTACVDFNNFTTTERVSLVVLSQTAHYSDNLSELAKRIYRALVHNGGVLLISTSHNQFRNLPYCLASPKILALEISRTPDKLEIIRIFLAAGFSLVSEFDHDVLLHFQNKRGLNEWFLSKPFSVLSLLSKTEFDVASRDFLKNSPESDITLKGDSFIIYLFKKGI